MFYGVTGPKGGGKSLGTTQRDVRRELALTRRTIITNLALNLPEIQATCDAEGIEADVTQRIIMLTTEQVGAFWLVHSRGVISDKEEDRQRIKVAGGRELMAPDFRCRENDGGIAYFIDEAHIYFDSYAWASIGADCRFYCTQERKLFDDTWLITQYPGQLAKAMRELVQDWTEYRNLDNEPIFGCRFPNKFKWRRTLRPSTGGSGDIVLATSAFKMSPRWSKCYDTNSGVGLRGVGEKTAATRMGLRWQIWAVVFVLGILLLMSFGFGTASVGLKFIREKVVSIVGIPVPKKDPKSLVPVQSVPARVEVERVSLPRESSGSHSATKRPLVFVERVFFLGARVAWELTDGRVFTPSSPGFVAGTEDRLITAEGVFERSPFSKVVAVGSVSSPSSGSSHAVLDPVRDAPK